jgi:hypothetical protein
MRSIGMIACAALALTACTSDKGKTWLRIDGRSVHSTPELAKQFELDGAICNGEMQKAGLSYGGNQAYGLVPALVEDYNKAEGMLGVARGCMAQRGYLHVDADKAGEIAAGLAAQKQ